MNFACVYAVALAQAFHHFEFILKEILFEEKSSSKLYRDYLNRVQKMVKMLDEANRQEILLEFNPGEKSLVLKQGGAEFTFTKE